MHRLKYLAAILTLALVASACGGEDTAPTNCEEIIDETIDLVQRLIDDLDAQFEELSVQEFVIEAEELDSFEEFREESAELVRLSESLECTDLEIATGVSERVGALTSETTVGRFMIDAIISGGLASS